VDSVAHGYGSSPEAVEEDVNFQTIAVDSDVIAYVELSTSRDGTRAAPPALVAKARGTLSLQDDLTQALLNFPGAVLTEGSYQELEPSGLFDSDHMAMLTGVADGIEYLFVEDAFVKGAIAGYLRYVAPTDPIDFNDVVNVLSAQAAKLP
jgi:hypothetical protein